MHIAKNTVWVNVCHNILSGKSRVAMFCVCVCVCARTRDRLYCVAIAARLKYIFGVFFFRKYKLHSKVLESTSPHAVESIETIGENNGHVNAHQIWRKIVVEIICINHGV